MATRFESLSEAQRSAHLADVAARAAPLWGVSSAARMTLLNISENATYRIDEPGLSAPLILRVHRTGYHSIDAIRSELAWMKALKDEAGVETPQALRTGAAAAASSLASYFGGVRLVSFDPPEPDPDLEEPALPASAAPAVPSGTPKLPAGTQGPPAGTQGPLAGTQGPPAGTQEPPAGTREPPAGTQGPPGGRAGSPQDAPGGALDESGGVMDPRGINQGG